MEQKRVIDGNGRIMLCNGVCINNNYECYCRFKDKNKYSYECREVEDYDRCDCCGRHISQLKPFGKAGDPLNGNFDGALLVKYYRSLALPLKELDEIMDEFYKEWDSEEDYQNDKKKLEKKLIEKYGQVDVEYMIHYHNFSQSVDKSLECRDCICLTEKRYFRVKHNIYRGKS